VKTNVNHVTKTSSPTTLLVHSETKNAITIPTIGPKILFYINEPTTLITEVDSPLAKLAKNIKKTIANPSLNNASLK
jgi:hypothetical protein